MRTVNDILSNKSAQKNIIHPGELVYEALKMMKNMNLSYVIAMDGDELKGIFSERNYAHNVALEGKTSKTCKIREAMSRTLIPIDPETTVEECINLILDTKSRYLPVMEDGKLVGIITIHDILREALRAKEAMFDTSLADQLMDAGGIY